MAAKRLDGKATPILFAKEGAHVIVSDIDDSAGESTSREIGDDCFYLPLDVQLEDDWKNAVKCVQHRFGKLSVLVNNAGVTGLEGGFGPQDPENASLSSWRKVHAVNSDGVFLGCKYAIQMMKSDKGAIVNVSSRSGLVGFPSAAAYAASKASVRNHTKTVALYCSQEGYEIRCNSVHPATILTQIWEPFLGSGSDRQTRMGEITNGIPMQNKQSDAFFMSC